MADIFYNAGKKNLINGGIDLDTDTIKIALVTSSYTPNKDTHDYFDDVTNEVSGAGYTAGGATLTMSLTQDDANDLIKVDAADVSWSSSTITARGAVIYKSTGTAGTSSLICYLDFGADKASVTGTFQVIFNSSGIFTLGE
jgi:hypothetical protein